MIRSVHLVSVAILLSAAAACAQSAAPVAQTPVATATQGSFEVPAGTRFFSLEHRSQSGMSAADAEVVRQQNRAVADEAKFYLFNVAEGAWTYEQVMCPEMPEQILLQYSSTQADGKDSRFNALIPRQGGRVRIIPVLYRGGAPFGNPVSNPRNFRIYNAAVPPDIARQSIDENGHWLSLAACYVELTAGHSHIPTEPAMSLEFVRAPDPTLVVQPALRQVMFSDRSEETKFVVWSVNFSKDGRVTGAGMERRDFAKGKMVPVDQVPVFKEVPAGAPPKIKRVPDNATVDMKPVPDARSNAAPSSTRLQAVTPADATTASGPIAPAVSQYASAGNQGTSTAWRPDNAMVPSDRKVKVVLHPSDPQSKVKTKPSYPQGKIVTPADTAPAPQD